MTFADWFDDYCADPDNKTSLNYLYTERQYFLLLGLVTTEMKISEVDTLHEGETRWLYNKTGAYTYRAVVMSYGAPSKPRQVGQVLMWQQAGKPEKGSSFPVDALKRVIPITQLVAAINHAHVDGTGHRGQDATEHKVNELFWGITRLLVREAVKRCPICQAKSAKQFKAKLQPIIANQLFERLLIDLIDLRRRPDRGFKYIMHVADHHSRFHFILPIKTKEATAVAVELAKIFAFTGGCKILQSDQGPEFRGDVTTLCHQFGVKHVRSSPYTPSTNGLVEKWNHVVKVGIAAWQTENKTRAWVDCLPVLAVQMNTTWSRSIRCSPFELVFGHHYRLFPKPVMARSQLDFLDAQEWAADPAQPDGPQLPPVSVLSLQQPPSPSTPPSPPSSPSSPPSPRPPPASRPTTAPDLFRLRDEHVTDCAFGTSGSLGVLAHALLNVGGLEFRRWGSIGNGRCGVSAVDQALHDCVWSQSRAALEVRCDSRREAYYDFLDLMSADLQKFWLKKMVDVGGGDAPVGDWSPQQVRARLRRSLLRDLEDVKCNLGWEFLVLAAAYHSVNVVLIPIVITGQPIEGVSVRVFPPEWQDGQDAILIYHRAVYTTNGANDSQADSGGHYEAVYCTAPGQRKVARFKASHPAWAHLRRLSMDESSNVASATMRARMEKDYNKHHKVHEFAIGASVGVRTDATKQRTKKYGANNVPAMVVATSDNNHVGGSSVGQRLYTCLTKYGVVDQGIKIDGLTHNTAGNDPVQTARFTELLNDGTWEYMKKLTIKSLLAKYLADMAAATPTVPARRQQPRAAAAAPSSEESGEEGADMDVELRELDDDDEGDDDDDDSSEEERKAPARAPSRAPSTTLALSQSKSHPIRILRQSGGRYQVLWNDPPGEKTWVHVSSWDSREEYRELVLAFRAQVQANRSQEEEAEE